jgi:hypothetical protein
MKEAAILFSLAFATNVVNASITYGMVRFNYRLALAAEAGAWTLWLLTVKFVYSATSPLAFVAFVLGAVLGLLVTMRLNQRVRTA